MNNRGVNNGGGNNRGVDHGGVVDGGVDYRGGMVWSRSRVVDWFRVVGRGWVVGRLRMVGWSRVVGRLRVVGWRGRSRVGWSSVVHSMVDRVDSVVDRSSVVYCVYCMVGYVRSVGYYSTVTMGNYMGGNQRGGGS